MNALVHEADAVLVARARVPVARARVPLARACVELHWCAALALTLCLGCRKQEEAVVSDAPVSSAPPAPASPDRLPPGKLIEGTERAFSLPLPKALRIDASFPSEIHAVGRVSAADLSDFVQARVLVRHVEMIGERIVFPLVKVRGGDDKVLRIEIFRRGADTWLRVSDETPRPGPQGLTEEERWKRTGLTPDGRLIDQQNLE